MSMLLRCFCRRSRAIYDLFTILYRRGTMIFIIQISNVPTILSPEHTTYPHVQPRSFQSHIPAWNLAGRGPDNLLHPPFPQRRWRQGECFLKQSGLEMASWGEGDHLNGWGNCPLSQRCIHHCPYLTTCDLLDTLPSHEAPESYTDMGEPRAAI